jgi:hypothetical protein
MAYHDMHSWLCICTSEHGLDSCRSPQKKLIFYITAHKTIEIPLQKKMNPVPTFPESADVILYLRSLIPNFVNMYKKDEMYEFETSCNVPRDELEHLHRITIIEYNKQKINEQFLDTIIHSSSKDVLEFIKKYNYKIRYGIYSINIKAIKEIIFRDHCDVLKYMLQSESKTHDSERVLTYSIIFFCVKFKKYNLLKELFEKYTMEEKYYEKSFDTDDDELPICCLAISQENPEMLEILLINLHKESYNLDIIWNYAIKSEDLVYLELLCKYVDISGIDFHNRLILYCIIYDKLEHFKYLIEKFHEFLHEDSESEISESELDEELRAELEELRSSKPTCQQKLHRNSDINYEEYINVAISFGSIKLFDYLHSIKIGISSECWKYVIGEKISLSDINLLEIEEEIQSDDTVKYMQILKLLHSNHPELFPNDNDLTIQEYYFRCILLSRSVEFLEFIFTNVLHYTFEETRKTTLLKLFQEYTEDSPDVFKQIKPCFLEYFKNLGFKFTKDICIDAVFDLCYIQKVSNRTQCKFDNFLRTKIQYIDFILSQYSTIDYLLNSRSSYISKIDPDIFIELLNYVNLENYQKILALKKPKRFPKLNLQITKITTQRENSRKLLLKYLPRDIIDNLIVNII